MKTLGRNIKKYRLKKHLRQEDLAEKTDLSVTYIGLIEREDKTPSLATFIKIANALNVSADMLLTEVIKEAYNVKPSLLMEKIEKLSLKDRERIFNIIDVLIKNSIQIIP